MNSNDYFSNKLGLPKTQIKLNQFGGSQGGPIKLPGFDGSGRAFFFVNYEEFYQPTTTPLRTRQILHPSTAQGIFRYNVTSGGVTSVREVNVLTVAADNGHTSSIDPTVGALVAQIRSLAEKAVSDGWGVLSDQNNVNLRQLDFKSPGKFQSPADDQGGLQRDAGAPVERLMRRRWSPVRTSEHGRARSRPAELRQCSQRTWA
jgi:hypothetical protein